MKPLLLLTAILFHQALFAQANRAAQYNVNSQHLAIEGYDPVAYFTQGKAVEGRSNLSANHQGIVYYFASPENRSAFLAAPSKYEPQYGGWCAYAMGAKGEKVSVDPETFKIVNGKLFLFYNSFFNNTLKSWNQDERNLHARADAAPGRAARPQPQSFFHVRHHRRTRFSFEHQCAENL